MEERIMEYEEISEKWIYYDLYYSDGHVIATDGTCTDGEADTGIFFIRRKCRKDITGGFG